MSISSTQLSNQIWHISATERLDHTQTDALEQALAHAIETTTPRLMLDLNGATYINSGGLRLLVSAWRMARLQGGNLVLFGLNDKVKDVFSLVGFDKVFQIVESETDALALWEQADA